MQRLFALAVALVTLAVSIFLVVGPVLGQLGIAPSPIPPHASVIAQGIAEMPSSELAWRITRATAPSSEPTARTLPGFLLADVGTLLLTDPETDAKTRLAAGEAEFAPAGAQLQETPLDPDSFAYYRIDLVPPAEAANPGNDAMVFVGQPFAPPTGERDLDLARNVINQDEVVELALESQAAPVLFLVTTGEVELVPTNSDSPTPVPLPAGQAVALGGDVTVRATSAGGATFVMAIIGPEASQGLAQEATPTATPIPELASLTLQAFACPVDYEGDQYATDCVEPIADVPFSLVGAQTGLAFDGATGPDGAAYFADLEVDTYTISGGPPSEFATQVVACDTGSDGATVALEAGANAVCTWYAVPEDAQGEGEGTVAVTVHYCPGTPIDPFVDCTTGDPSGAVIYGPVVLTTDASGEAGGVPYGTYALQPGAIGVPQGYEVAEVRGAAGASADGWTFALDEANPNAALQVIFVPSGGSQADTNADGDADGDGLSDEREGRLGTDPANPDSDGDGVLDSAEVEAGSDPATSDVDSDSDGFTDNQEAAGGTDPADPASVPIVESAEPTTEPVEPPTVPGNPSADTDRDGLPDGLEAQLGSDPAATDSDGDSLSDGAEVGLAAGAATGTNPTVWDTDGDGVGDGDELAAGTNPLDPSNS